MVTHPSFYGLFSPMPLSPFLLRCLALLAHDVLSHEHTNLTFYFVFAFYRDFVCNDVEIIIRPNMAYLSVSCLVTGLELSCSVLPFRPHCHFDAPRWMDGSVPIRCFLTKEFLHKGHIAKAPVAQCTPGADPLFCLYAFTDLPPTPKIAKSNPLVP